MRAGRPDQKDRDPADLHGPLHRERAMEILKEELGDMAEQIYTGFEIEV